MPDSPQLAFCSFLDTVANIGAKTDREWRRHDRDMGCLSEISSDILSQRRLHESFCVKEAVDWLAHAGEIPEQIDLLAQFGGRR